MIRTYLWFYAVLLYSKLGVRKICCLHYILSKCTVGNSTNVGPTNVGRYKGRTVQTSDWYKRRTGTNVELVQTSNWYKRRTGINVRPVQTSDGYVYKKKRWTLVEFEKRPLL